MFARALTKVDNSKKRLAPRAAGAPLRVDPLEVLGDAIVFADAFIKADNSKK